MDYALDGEVLRAKSLPSTFLRGSVIPRTIFVTGATGFLGAAILDNLLSRNDGIRVIALVRANSSSEAFQRVKTACIAYSTWSDVPQVPYSQWRAALEQYVSTESRAKEPQALLPLFDWVTADLPSETDSRDLDDTNARAVLEASGVKREDCEVEVTQETVGTYLAFMAEVGFVGRPEGGKEVMGCRW